jgi:hypothetical protein
MSALPCYKKEKRVKKERIEKTLYKKCRKNIKKEKRREKEHSCLLDLCYH